MFRYQWSIRSKITIGYYGTVAVVVGLSLFTFLELRFLEKKIMVGEIISEFFDTTLEIRRFEKNYVLYRQESDYVENLRYVAKARELFESDLNRFKTIVSEEQIMMLRNNLAEYMNHMERYASLHRKTDEKGPFVEDAMQKTILEGEIRKIGKDITTFAEEASRAERRNLQILLYKSQRRLIFSIISLAMLAIVVGQILTRMVVRPLKSLEGNMKAIAEGKFETVSIDSGDREIVSLTSAFNKMLRELDLRQRHLIQSEKLASLGTLLSGVAHELNNPLSNISLSCQILMEEIGERSAEQSKELLSMIDEQTERAKNIVSSLLEFSREREFQKDLLPLRRLFEETIRFVKGQVPTRVEISLDIPEGINVFVDKQRIQQAFLNLIKNALEAIADDGSISIRAKRHRVADKTAETEALFNYLKYRGTCTLEGDTVDIEIADTGSGIPAEVLPKIFDPFFTTKNVGRGSGLGLSIVHEIIEEHDGCIAVESEVGKGTRFFISLPAKEL
ncbi:MAG: ATP-binding protein [Nitrospirae bacterium]|nr:ATP-binding protein [Nitrospirota bacterium]